MIIHVFLLQWIVFRFYCVALSCLDDEGRAVEWFVGYKLPGSYDYTYLLPGMSEWKNSTMNITSEGMLKNTFTIIFKLKGNSNSMYGVYNDEKPNVGDEPHYNYWWGHMKGALAYQPGDSGLWIIHSIPKLSVHDDEYDYPPTGYVYGQHFLCVSLGPNDLPTLIKQLIVSRPLFQRHYISSSVIHEFPDSERMLQNKNLTREVNVTAQLHSRDGGLEMKHFSKSLYYGKDLYHAFVAPVLHHGLLVESWRHGKNEPSECSLPSIPVKNIRQIKFSKLHVAFPTMNDHAKWAVTLPLNKQDSGENKWVCLGDINRQITQLKRGGGTLCIRKHSLWNAFNELIGDIEDCPPQNENSTFYT